MPQINRIRVNNVKYNFGTQMYDDFMMRPNCSSMIYDLANGGGKSLLMLMLLQNVIPNCTLDEKQPVEKLFRQGGGNTVIHSLVEWKLEPCYRKDNYTYMTTGFCARKAGAQSNSSGIEYFNYAIFYREFGDNDIKNLPLTSNGERITYNGLKEYLRNLEKDDFNVSVKIFDRKGDYQNFLSHYGIYESQWEIIRGINKTEGHVRTYFESNYRTSRKVVEDLLIEEIIEKSFNNKLGVTDDEGQMARTLLDIKDKLLELSKKNSQIGNYNSQVEEIEKFAQYAESFKLNFIKKQELEEKIYRLLCACKIIIADREALSEQNSSDLEKIQEKINNEQYLIQSAQVASEQKSLDAIRELVDVYSAKIEAADSRFAERKELLRKSESVNDYADYLKYENDFNKIKQTIDNRMREHDDITAELHDIAVKIFELSNDEREKLKESLKQSQKELQTAKDNYKEAQKTFDSLTKEEAAAQSLVSFLKSRIENDEKQMAVLMEKCGIIIAENVEAELLTSEENIKDARQEIQQKDKAYNDLKRRLGDTQTDIARIDVGLEFIKKEIEDVKKIQAEYEQTKDKLNTLSKIYNDENTAGLDIKIKEYSDSLDSEYFEAEKEAQRLAAFIENAKKHQYLLDAKNRTKLKEYLFTRYKDDVKEGADWLAQLDEKQRTDVKRRIPFVEYSFIVKNNFDKIKNDATLASFNLDSYTVPIVSEDNVLDAKVQIDKNTVVFAMKDMDFLKDDAKTESEIAAAQEELDNINHKIEKIEDRRKVVLSDYCYVINNKMQRFEKASDDLRRLTENMSQSRENHEKLKAEEQLLKKQCDSAAAQAESAKKTYTEECSRYEILKLAKKHKEQLAGEYAKQRQALLDADNLSRKLGDSQTDVDNKKEILENVSKTLAVYEQKIETAQKDWEENYNHFYDMDIDTSDKPEKEFAGMTYMQLESRFFGLKDILDKEMVDVADKEALMEHYRISMEKCKKAIEYRGDDFETVKSDFETGKTIVSDAQELLHIKQQIADIEKETRTDRDEFDAQNALMNRLEGSIAHAVSQIKERFGEYEPLSCENPESYISQHKNYIKELDERTQRIKAEIAGQAKALKKYYICEKDLERIVTDAGMDIPDEEAVANVFRQNENAYDLKILETETDSYEKISKDYSQLVKLIEKRREDFQSRKEQFCRRLVEFDADELSAEMNASINIPSDCKDVEVLCSGLRRTNEYIVLEKERVSKGIEDMEQIKDNFENRCIQTCCNIKTELDRLPGLSTIRLDDEIISMIGLFIPYVKEELYKSRMSLYIDETIAMSESISSQEERLKYIRNRLTWKRLFSVIVTDMNAIRVQLYKRERIKDQSRYLRYEEAVGSTGQSQGIYIQFLIAVINYIASVNASVSETAVLGKTIFIDNPFGAAKDIYIWEPIFKLLKTNHVQLIVPARGATPAITGRFDVNYILGQKLVDGRQQTVVVDYYSRTNTTQLEYTRMDYEQTSFEFFV